MKRLCSHAMIFAVLLFACTPSAFALSMNPFKREGRTRAETLFITGNFREPRLLAELAQYRTKQPVLIITPDGYGNHTLFFVPSGTKPMQETSDNFAAFLDFINPARVIILGNADFVPAQFVDLAQKKFPVLVIPNTNMDITAKLLASLLDQPKLVTDYNDYLGRLLKADAALSGSGN